MDNLRNNANEDAAYMMEELNAENLVERMMSWILSANDRWMKRSKSKVARKLVWWTEELSRMKRKVRRCRRAYQHERRANGKRAIARADEYKRARIEYKECIWRMKEANWRQFVSETGNQDPWGDV